MGYDFNIIFTMVHSLTQPFTFLRTG